MGTAMCLHPHGTGDSWGPKRLKVKAEVTSANYKLCDLEKAIQSPLASISTHVKQRQSYYLLWWAEVRSVLMRHRLQDEDGTSHACLLPPAAHSAPSHGGTLRGTAGFLTPPAGTSAGQATFYAPGMNTEWDGRMKQVEELRGGAPSQAKP